MRPLKMLEAGSSVQVAWVGNSFVFFNKLPRMVASMLKHDGIELIQKHVLVAGQGLDGHSRDEKVWKLLASKEWNYVILQDQSSVPGGADEVKLGESIAALASFFALRLPPADRGKVILYSTWGHKTGSPLLLHFKEAYPNFEEMNTKVTDGYRRYKHALLHARPSLDVGIAAVGTAFHSVYLAEVEQGRDPDDPHSLFSRLFFTGQLSSITTRELLSSMCFVPSNLREISLLSLSLRCYLGGGGAKSSYDADASGFCTCCSSKKRKFITFTVVKMRFKCI